MFLVTPAAAKTAANGRSPGMWKPVPYVAENIRECKGGMFVVDFFTPYPGGVEPWQNIARRP
jgi:hypothetical protein